MTVPITFRPVLTPSTIVPESWDLFIPYFNRVLEDVSTSVNARDFNFFPMAISNTPQSIINLPTFGAFLICVSGSLSGLPTITASVCKSSATSSASIVVLGSQVGTIAPFVGASLTISSTSSNIQINHSVANTSGNFNIRVIGTQI